MKPIVPSADVCAKYEEYRSLVIDLLEMKKTFEKLQQEMKSKGRKISMPHSSSLTFESAEPSEPTSAISMTPDVMNVKSASFIDSIRRKK